MHVLGWVANGILVLDTGSVYYMLACLLAISGVHACVLGGGGCVYCLLAS
jgi:hypothetical protein